MNPWVKWQIKMGIIKCFETNQNEIIIFVGCNKAELSGKFICLIWKKKSLELSPMRRVELCVLWIRIGYLL